MIKIRKILLGIAFFLLGFFILTLGLTRVTEVHADREVCFCHNVQHNPHTICTDNQGEIRGHLGHVHNGTDYLGQCRLPTPRPSPTSSPRPSVVPSATPTPRPTPSISPRCEDDCDEPTPSPSALPSASPDTCKENCGWSPTFPHDLKYDPPVCTTEVPKPAENTQYKKDDGNVTVSWEHDGTNLTAWSLNYGKTPDDMPYGIPFMQREAREVTVGGIEWEGELWFALCGYNGGNCQSCKKFDP